MKDAGVVIGTTLPRADGPNKITGREKYAADWYPEGMLWVGIKTSDYAHALIKNIDASLALQIQGVKAVLTCKDVMGSNRVGLPEGDQPVLADDKIRYRGDAVALILAESRELLQEAADRIEVVYQELPAVFDPELAMLPEAPVLHEHRAEKNILLSDVLERGNGEAAFKDCHAVVEARYILPSQEHSYLETETGVAWLNDEGALEVVASTQTPFRDRMELAHALGFPLEKIKVSAPYLGGGFGGKDGITVQAHLALAALNSGGRPVKMWNTREMSFLSSTKRHPARLHYRLGCKADGSLEALSCRIIMDTGAYAQLGGPILEMALEHAAGVYRVDNVNIEAVSVYTNNPVSGAFRGFGATQALAGIEQTMDILADKIGMDPLEFRLKNAVNRGEEIGSGVLMMGSTGIRACLSRVQEHPLWLNRREWEKAAPPFKKRAVGVAAGLQGTGYGPMIADIANAKLELLQDGRFRIYSGVADMGQGNNATNIQVAGEALKQMADAFELWQPDTANSLPSGSSAASRTTFSYANALVGACRQLEDRVLIRACNMGLGYLKEDLMLLPGRVRHLPSGKDIPLAVIAGTMTDAERIAVYAYKAPVAGKAPTLVGPAMQVSGFPHLVFAFACHLARIEIDEITGEISVYDYLACTDGGKVLNPQVYEQQIQGGIVQGMGYALWEDFKMDKGEVLCRNLASYIIPTSLDVPDLISLPVETVEESGPFGMKGIGEISINLPLPAIANAVYSGIGWSVGAAPLTAERVLLALHRDAKEAADVY